MAASFKKMINATSEELPEFFRRFEDVEIPTDKRMEAVSTDMALRPAQIICAVGFNPNTPDFPELSTILGFDSFEILCQQRNEIFTTDIYKALTLDNTLTIYNVIKDHPEMLRVMQYLLKLRLQRIESRIEETVNSLIIEKYKAEIRAVYNGGIANIEFAEERLGIKGSGFRALLNEVGIIVESRLIPAGDIFFRDTILPEEKRRLLNKGLIPRELIETRLEDDDTPQDEKRILYDYLKLHKD
jgi:hypothetical protein